MLVERAREGDHDAFTVLAGASIARLDAAARLILRDGELARDAVQEAMVRSWRDLPTLRDVDRFDAWLHRLLVNSCLDIMRRRRRRAIEVELTPILIPITADFTSGRGRSRSPRSWLAGPRPQLARDRGAPLLPWDAVAGGRLRFGHPARHGQVPAASGDRSPAGD